MDRAVIAVVTPVGIALLYFLLAGEVSSGEVVACGIALAIACPYAVAVARTGMVTLQVPARGVGALLRATGSIVPDLWRVGRALLQAMRQPPTAMLGVVKQIPFRFGAFDAADVGRRAAVTVAMSLAPNGIVVGMDHENDALILHQLADNAVGGDREWPL